MKIKQIKTIQILFFILAAAFGSLVFSQSAQAGPPDGTPCQGTLAPTLGSSTVYTQTGTPTYHGDGKCWATVTYKASKCDDGDGNPVSKAGPDTVNCVGLHTLSGASAVGSSAGSPCAGDFDDDNGQYKQSGPATYDSKGKCYTDVTYQTTGSCDSSDSVIGHSTDASGNKTNICKGRHTLDNAYPDKNAKTATQIANEFTADEQKRMAECGARKAIYFGAPAVGVPGHCQDTAKTCATVKGQFTASQNDPNTGTCAVPTTTADTAPDSCGEAKTNLIGCQCAPGVECLGAVLKIVLFVLTIVLGIVAVGGIVYGAILYASAEDNSGQTSKAKGIIRDVVIGLFLYGFMIAIINWLVPGGVIG